MKKEKKEGFIIYKKGGPGLVACDEKSGAGGKKKKPEGKKGEKGRRSKFKQDKIFEQEVQSQKRKQSTNWQEDDEFDKKQLQIEFDETSEKRLTNFLSQDLATGNQNQPSQNFPQELKNPEFGSPHPSHSRDHLLSLDNPDDFDPKIEEIPKVMKRTKNKKKCKKKKKFWKKRRQTKKRVAPASMSLMSHSNNQSLEKYKTMNQQEPEEQPFPGEGKRKSRLRYF